MAGIYIHIPFCKKACHYCDFHFSTNTKHKEAFLEALQEEVGLRKGELSEPIDTIYFGGGTPSLLSVMEIEKILATVAYHFEINPEAEITMEANPDDLNATTIKKFAQTKINRLSIGIQSFVERDLIWMNRAHSAKEAKDSLLIAQHYFDNISIDLIYGTPGLTDAEWQDNIAFALASGVVHISSYALTVEPKTALSSMIRKGKSAPVEEAQSQRQFELLQSQLEANGFIAYETSNYAKPGYFSKHNSSYWKGVSYLGFGPSAHSYRFPERSWNVSNNNIYIRKISQGELPSEKEILSTADAYNEYVMTGLRTIWGISLSKIQTHFGAVFAEHFFANAQTYLDQKLLCQKGNTVLVTAQGKFLVDGISSALFYI